MWFLKLSPELLKALLCVVHVLGIWKLKFILQFVLFPRSNHQELNNSHIPSAISDTRHHHHHPQSSYPDLVVRKHFFCVNEERKEETENCYETEIVLSQ